MISNSFNVVVKQANVRLNEDGCLEFSYILELFERNTSSKQISWKFKTNLDKGLVVVVVYIFRYFRLYLQKSIKNNKEEGRSGTTGTGVSQKDLQRGAKRTNKKFY